eukprot:8393093-Ditylum_brightwellii.AAC.1
MSVVANTLSCQDNDNDSTPSSINNKLFLLEIALIANNIKGLKSKKINSFSEKPDDIIITEYYIDKEDSAIPLHSYPLNFKLIQKEQQKDKAFLEALKKSKP